MTCHGICTCTRRYVSKPWNPTAKIALVFCARWGSNISCPRHPTKLVLSWRVFPAPNAG